MGHLIYMARVVLGRSAYDEPLERCPDEDEAAQEAKAAALEATASGSYVPGAEGYVQQYDRRGYPQNLASRLLSRQSRRAQNDVLASVGVCVDERATGLSAPPQFARKHHSAEKSKIKLIKRENEIGLSIAAADFGLFCLAGVFLLGLRHRMQAFRFYSGVPFVETIKIEWKHFGSWQFLFGGAPASLLYLALDMSQAYVINSIYNIFMRYLLRTVRSEKRRQNARMALDLADYIAAMFVLITPLEIFASLQRLDLVPSWPLFPNPMALIPFTSGSPIQAHNIAQSSGPKYYIHLLASLAYSPLGLWWVLFHARTQVDQKLYAYMRIGLPKPDYPDAQSWKGAREDELDNDTIPGLGLTKDLNDFVHYEPTNLFEEIKKDVLELVASFRGVLRKWRIMQREEEKGEDEGVFEEPLLIPTAAISTQTVPTGPEDIGRSSSRIPLGQIPPIPESLRPTIDSIPFSYLHENRDRDLDNISTGHPSRPSNGVFILPQPSASQELGDSNPPIPITAATTPTRMDGTSAPIEAPNISSPVIPSTAEYAETTHPVQSNARIVPTPSSPRSHHVTGLTAHFADALGCHLSTHLADLLFLPLEALFIRSVAIGFLSSPVAARSATAAALRSQVFPPGSWFGMGLRGGTRAMMDYAGKMALCASLDLGVGYVVWQLGAGVAWWVGGRWFQWGRL